jgi:hypothetical protein
MRSAYKISLEKPEGKESFGISGRSWVDSIKIDLKGTGYEDMDSIHLAHERIQWRAFVNTALKLQVLYKSGNFLTS